MNGQRENHWTWLHKKSKQLSIKEKQNIFFAKKEIDFKKKKFLLINNSCFVKKTGSKLWTNVIELFKNYETEQQLQESNTKQIDNSFDSQDVGLSINAMTLINKTLAGISD